MSALPTIEPVLRATECMPPDELERRHARCRNILAAAQPEAEGLLVFSRLHIYYLTGTWADGVLWLPLTGAPVLMARKGLERCRAESPVPHIRHFSCYKDMVALCEQCQSPLGRVIAVEMGGTSWVEADKIQHALHAHTLHAGDAVLSTCRAVKSSWELHKMRLAGQRHDQALSHLLPARLRPGMSERHISHEAWKVFFSLGHGGINRMGNYGEECFLGHVAAGENGNYPSHFNGPLGLRGEHPAVPVMGSAESLWQKNSLLALDIGFMLEGYHTDKTQVYWSGPAASIPDVVRRAHDACMEIQQRAAEALKPGAIPSRIWEEAVQRAESLGVQQGFMGLAGNKVQFLGHGIGLVIDESPVLARRFDLPLEEGMVLAIEPKVGLTGMGMTGVENTFEVTPRGGRCLTGQSYDIICVE